MRRWRGPALAVASGVLLAGLLSACNAGDQSPAVRAAETDSAAPDPDPLGISALDNPAHPDLPKPLIDPELLLAGGPPPDGIPPIDEPMFAPARTIDWLSADEPVLLLTVGGETRGYPIQIMTWHEIANDTVGGVPVAVTYCPLCNSGVAFERTVDGEVTTFGTSGKLYADNLVMYDRRTESLWPQLSGTASWGVLTGTRLRAIPMGTVGWEQFVSDQPDALVLTRDTGTERDYGRNPYVGYDKPSGEVYFDLPTEPDDRLEVKTRVVGVEIDGETVALRRERVREAGVIGLTLGGQHLVAWHRPGQRSALDGRAIDEGREIGTVGVFSSRVAGRRLRFTRSDEGFVDRETESTWTVTGRAVAGPLRGRRLTPVTHLDTFWFSWVTFHPDTRLIS